MVGRIAHIFRKANWKINYTRKIFHFIIFTTAFIIGILLPIHTVAAFGAGAAVVISFTGIFPGVPLLSRLYSTLAREGDEPHRTYYLLVPLLATALAGLTTAYLFPALYQLGYLVSGWGDASGEPIGVRFGRHRYRVPTLTLTRCTRSLEGSAAVFTLSFLAAVLALFYLGFKSVLLPAFTASLFATLAEAVSPHGWDNFTVQIAACFGAWLVV